MEGLIVTINLPGRIGGLTKHVNREKHTIKMQNDVYISKVILHSDRGESTCFKKLNISEEILNMWCSDEVPSWSTNKKWKMLTNEQKVLSYVKGLDEGFGFSLEYLS